MKYNKNPYYLNTELRNKKKNEEPLFDPVFTRLVETMDKNDVESVYEVGFDFGQRLDYMESKGLKIEGGVEFNASFNLYRKHFNLMDRGWDIRFNQLDFWNPTSKNVVVTSHFLDLFDEEDQNYLLNKLKFMSNFLYLNENIDIEDSDEILDRYRGVYVIDCTGYVLEESTEGTKTPQPELPSFESLRDRINSDESIIPEVNGDETGGSNPPSGFQW